MQSRSPRRGPVADRLSGETVRHGWLLWLGLLATSLWGQPASITSVTQPVFGAEIFDNAGNLYGFASGPVTPGALQTQNGGGTCLVSNGFFDTPEPCSDAYVSKIDPSGNLVWGTYLGGPTADQASALAVDSAGNVVVVGSTGGSFPTTANAALPASTTSTSFAAKISADGRRLLYSTYLPVNAATATAVALDAQGNAYIAGGTATFHAYVLKLSADGSSFLYNVALGGSNPDAATAVAVDVSGDVVVAGQTTSADFPVTAGALQGRLLGAQNIFLVKLDPTGRVLFSTYLGGSGRDAPSALEIDPSANIYLAGQTTSLDFPTTQGSFEPAAVVPLWNNSGPGGFAAKLNAGGSLAWSTYAMSLDHPTEPGISSLAVGPSGDVYLAALTGAGFPVTASAPQACYQGPNADVLVAHLDFHGALLDATYVGQNVNYTPAPALAVTDGGTVSIAWNNTQGQDVRSEIVFGQGVSAAACVSPSVLNSATLSSGTSAPAVVPGEIITLTGLGIGPDSGVASAAGPQPELGGVQVLFDGQPAPLFYVQSRQINAQAPVELNGKAQTTITVMYNQAVIGSMTATVTPFGIPGIYRLQPGNSTQAAAENGDGSVNSASNPAAPGSVVAVWGTGFGLTDPPCTTGGFNPLSAVNLATGLSAAIADGPGLGIPERTTLASYAGSAPTLACGVEQINFAVPSYVPPGMYQFFPVSRMLLSNGGTQVVQGTVGVTIYVK